MLSLHINMCPFSVCILILVHAMPLVHSKSYPIETLVFVEQPQDTTVPLNQTAEFTCITNLPSIKRWLKNSLPLQFPAGSSKFEETENTLKIHLVEFADMGSYTCVVQLAGEVIEESGYLTADGR